MNENKIACAYCGELHDESDLTDTSLGLVCDDCLDNHFDSCEHCGSYFPYEDGELEQVRTGWRANEYWCSDCRDQDAYQCDDCGDYFTSRYEGCVDEDGFTLCQSCYEDDYRHCDECGCLVHEDNVSWDDDDNFICDSCASSRRSIHSYSYKPDPDFGYRHGESPNTLTFGVECEVDDGEDDRYDTAEAVTEAGKGRVY